MTGSGIGPFLRVEKISGVHIPLPTAIYRERKAFHIGGKQYNNSSMSLWLDSNYRAHSSLNTELYSTNLKVIDINVRPHDSVSSVY